MPPPPKGLAARPKVTPRPTRVLAKRPPPAPKAGPVALPQSNAAASASLRTGSKPGVLDRFQSAGQNAVGNSAVAAAQRAKGKPEDKPQQQTPPEEGAAGGKGKRGADRDPKFASLKKDVQRKKRGVASSHPPPRAEASSAQDAAAPPKDDEQAQGKTANAEKMNEAKPKEFDKAAFVKAVEDAIARKAPKNLDEADKFADSGKPAEIKADVQGRVGEGKSDSAEQISATTAAPPDTSAAVTKQVVPMAPDRPPGPPGTPNPANAAPDTLPPSATDMSAGPAQVNQQMANAQVTETQLKKSNEPQFTKALDEKKTAEQHSETAPGELRQNESAQLKQTTAQAKKLGAAAMTAMAAKRVSTGQQVGSGKEGAKSKDEDKRAQVTALLQKVFDTMKTEVEGILTALDQTVDKEFTEGEKKARDEFTDEHKRNMEAYKDERYSGAWGWARWLDDKFTGLPAEADKIFDEARDNYVANMRRVISSVADTIGRELNKAKARIAKGREELQAEVKKLPTDLQSLGKEAAAGFADQFDSLTQSVDDKGTELVDTLATKYTDALKSVDDEIAAEKEKNKGLIAKAIDAVKAVINTIIELTRMLLSILAKAAQAVSGIIRDPIGFLGNLVRAVGAGLRQFMANIGTHLPQGILSWLVGRAAEAGLQLPAKFDTRGVLTMLAGILGLTPAAIWARISRRLPPQAAAAAERAVPIVAQIRRQGIAGMWDDLKTRVGDLRKQLIDKVVEYAKPAIIIAGITWIISLLNPASAFVRAVKLIIDIVRFVVTQARQIFEFVNAVLDAVIAIARGSGGGVPGLIERALVRAIPVLLGFLATLLGLGGLAAKVRQIIQTISRPVGRAIDAVIDKIIGLVKRALPKSKAKPARKKPAKKPKQKKDRDKPKRPKKPRRPIKRKDEKPRKPKPDSKKKQDSRSPAEKQRDLDRGLDAAHALVKKRKPVKKILAKLPGIKKKFRMSSLVLVVDQTKQGEQVAHLEGAVNPTGKRDKETLPLSKIHEAIAANGGELGATVGEGGFGVVRQVPTMPSLVVKTAKGGGTNPQLDKEANALVLLESKGIPTPYRDRITWTDSRGVTHTGIVMDRITGAFSKQVLEMGKFENTIADPAEKALLNTTTVQDLIRLKETCIANSINIDDIQFMITQDGSIRVIDPARIQDLSGLKPKQRKPVMATFAKRIDRIISQVRDIAGQ